MSALNIAAIRIDGGTQSRAHLNDAVVSDYAEAIRDGANFPPVIVFFDGSDYWLADGFHRHLAHMEAGRSEIEADIRQGTRRDAILHSVGANASHGLRRTNDDKRRAVLVLLNDPEWSEWSDREIARQCQVDHKTVGKLRADHLGISPDTRKVERKGTTYQQNTANIGGASKPDPKPAPQQSPNEPAESPAEQPEASNDDAEPQEQIEPEVEKVMRKHAGLTREALLRDYAELVIASKAERAALKAEIEGLKSKIALFEAEGDIGRKLGMALRERDTLNGRLSEYMQIAKREEYKRKKAEARVAELERMDIAI